MALKDLKTSTMVTITGPWLDPKKQRPAFERLPRVSAFLPDIDEAHQGLIKFQKKESALSAELGRLTEKTTALDVTHDRKARGVWYVLTGLAELVDDDVETDGILTARTELIPTGLLVVNPSYRDEAGAAKLVEGRLTAESKKILKDTQVAGKPLAKWVDGWLRAAHELGEVEGERVKLRSLINGEPGVGGDAVRARNQWIRIVSTVLQALELEKDIDAKTRKDVLEQLESALAKVSRRTAKPKGDDDVVGDGAVDDGQGAVPPAGGESAPA
jgi:hypothetical protein